jgi:nicotinamidase-related amidase
MSSCLLIVDVQNGFINDSTKHIPELVEKLQSSYQFVYVTRFFNKEDSFYRKLINWNRFDKTSTDFSLAFEPAPDAHILDKSIYTCVNASFLQELNGHGIDAVDVCGVDTDICVTKCAVDLFENGIIPRVLAKYCASHAGYVAHEAALRTLGRYIGKSQVVTE